MASLPQLRVRPCVRRSQDSLGFAVFCWGVKRWRSCGQWFSGCDGGLRMWVGVRVSLHINSAAGCGGVACPVYA